jgi:hypothetical protein
MAQRKDRAELHRQILEVLLEKVRADPYPSVTVLDMIEQSLEPDDVEEYTGVLMEKIKADTYPSFDQLRRLQQFA